MIETEEMSISFVCMGKRSRKRRKEKKKTVIYDRSKSHSKTKLDLIQSQKKLGCYRWSYLQNILSIDGTDEKQMRLVAEKPQAQMLRKHHETNLHFQWRILMIYDTGTSQNCCWQERSTPQ